MLAPGGAAVRGWLRLLPWVLLLGGLGASGWWRYYLAPRHMPYLWAGLGVLALVLLASELDGLAGRTRRRRTALLAHAPLPAPPRPASLADWLEAAVHWLPLLLLLTLGPTTLSLRGGAPSSRQLHRLRPSAPRAIPAPAAPAPGAPTAYHYAPPPAPEARPDAKPQPPGADAATLPARPDAGAEAPPAHFGNASPPERQQPSPPAAPPVARQSASAPARPALPDSPKPSPPAEPGQAYAQTDLVKLFTGRGGPLGGPVELIGRLHRVRGGDDEVVPLGVDPASTDLVLYRYAIWCCVADAVPATAILEGAALEGAGGDGAAEKGAGGLQDEQWVRLRGRFYQTGATGDIPLLKVDSLEPIPEPADPYLYAGPSDL
jgi:hypothetical protein